jgi:hypothetical protein
LIPIKLGLEGIRALTDETGMLQHTKYLTVVRREGYTTDDNARALIAALRYNQVYRDQDALNLANTYLTFLLHMQTPEGRFHNLLGFDRRFKDEVGSEDCVGRALWATGFMVGSEVPKDMRNAAKEIFDRGLPAAHGFTSPRAVAFTILGLCSYQQAQPDDGNLKKNTTSLVRRLMGQFEAESVGEWHWFESYLTYSNPRLPQALFATQESTGDEECLRVAKSSLDFLLETQMLDGVFVPIGTKGWCARDGTRAMYDQQPIEASCMVEACLAAFNSTGNGGYRDAALRAFGWYHGRNTLGVELYNGETGTCYDGITLEGLNQNQGAESTLSYYLAYLSLKERKLV